MKHLFILFGVVLATASGTAYGQASLTSQTRSEHFALSIAEGNARAELGINVRFSDSLFLSSFVSAPLDSRTRRSDFVSRSSGLATGFNFRLGLGYDSQQPFGATPADSEPSQGFDDTPVFVRESDTDGYVTRLLFQFGVSTSADKLEVFLPTDLSQSENATNWRLQIYSSLLITGQSNSTSPTTWIIRTFVAAGISRAYSTEEASICAAEIPDASGRMASQCTAGLIFELDEDGGPSQGYSSPLYAGAFLTVFKKLSANHNYQPGFELGIEVADELGGQGRPIVSTRIMALLTPLRASLGAIFGIGIDLGLLDLNEGAQRELTAFALVGLDYGSLLTPRNQ